MTREEACIELYVAQADVWYRPSDDAIDMAIKALEQEPKTGYWIQVDDIADAFDCSECDARVSRKYNYCPKCGAKMESGDIYE